LNCSRAIWARDLNTSNASTSSLGLLHHPRLDMPPPRAARSRPAKIESDSDGDTDRETTPKPISSGLRRRLSDHPQNGQDGEDTSGKRAPVPAVTVNDDAAEKRRRRKSARMTVQPPDEEEQPAAGPSNISAGPTGNGPVRTPGRGLQRLESVAHVEPINVPRDVMSSNFEEWMKMATDNVSNSCVYVCSWAYSSCRKSMLPTHGTLLSSTTSTICLFCVIRTIILSTSSVHPVLSTLA
jgi:hypothetical protein